MKFDCLLTIVLRAINTVRSTARAYYKMIPIIGLICLFHLWTVMEMCQGGSVVEHWSRTVWVVGYMGNVVAVLACHACIFGVV